MHKKTTEAEQIKKHVKTEETHTSSFVYAVETGHCVKSKSKEGSKNYGFLFSQHRHKMNISLEKVAQDLCIQVRYLKAIEENKLSILPEQRVFSLGFVKLYANYLGLNGTALSQHYQLIIDAHLGQSDVEQNNVQIQKAPLPQWAMISCLLFVVCTLIWLWFQFYNDKVLQSEFISLSNALEENEKIPELKKTQP